MPRGNVGGQARKEFHNPPLGVMSSKTSPRSGGAGG
jgi:hypothetical protein